MRFTGGLAAVLCGTAVVIVSPLVAKALTASQVYSIAQEITVRIDGANTGSGIIIERQGDSYTVVTCWHVVQLKGSYTIQTHDGRKYTINNSQVKQLGDVDLVVFQFSSNENYRVAEKGNSEQVTGGKNVYVTGYPSGIPGIPGRIFLYLEGKISGRVPNPKDGYALVYIVPAFQGMSGGPILDEEGKLTGIHGRAGTELGGGGTAVFGIPLKTYLSFVPSTPPTTTTKTETTVPLDTRVRLVDKKINDLKQQIDFITQAKFNIQNQIGTIFGQAGQEAKLEKLLEKLAATEKALDLQRQRLITELQASEAELQGLEAIRNRYLPNLRGRQNKLE